MQSKSCKVRGITSWNHDCWKKYQQSQICRWHHANGRKQRRTKEPLDEWKSGLKLNVQKTKIMASSPITSWQIDRQKMGTETDFIFLGSKITAHGDCSHKIKSHLKSYGKLRQHILKQRHHFANKGLSSQSYGFSSSHVDVIVGPLRRLSARELMLSNCAAREDSWECLGQQGDQISQS